MTDRYEGFDDGKAKQGGVRTGFAAQLPKCFEYKKELGQESAARILSELCEAEVWGFAATTHPFDNTGKVTLWMTQQVLEYLVEIDHLQEAERTVPFQRR